MRGLRHGRQTEREDRGQGQKRPEPLEAHRGSQLEGEALRGGKTEAAVHGDSFLTAPKAGVVVQTTGGALRTPPQSAKAESREKSVQDLNKKVRFFREFQADHGRLAIQTGSEREVLPDKCFILLPNSNYDAIRRLGRAFPRRCRAAPAFRRLAEGWNRRR